ncbi:hypothetical protein FO519_002434 [Halicephalobus sp. NKZ332]|nr:hypothetical protein FO519_002434 [Halicephalobus sp. NKZ332]
MGAIKILLSTIIFVNFVKCQNFTDYGNGNPGSVDGSGDLFSTSPSTGTPTQDDYYYTDDGTTTVDNSGGGVMISVDNVTLPTVYTTVSPRQVPYQPMTQGYPGQFQQNQGPQPAICNTLGCQPLQVNQQEYLASAEQYSYPNMNFQPQQPALASGQGGPSGFVGTGPQYYPNNQVFSGGQNSNQGQFAPGQQNPNQGQFAPGQQNFNQGQFAPGQQNPNQGQFAPGQQNPNQGQFAPGQQNLQYPQGNQGFGPQFDQNQGQILSPENNQVQKLTYVNTFNDSIGRPIVEQVNVTKIGDGQSNITVSKTEFPNSNGNQQGPGFLLGGGGGFPPQGGPGNFPQQNPNFAQQNQNFPQQNPNFAQQNQNFPQQNQNFPQQNPNFAQQNQNFAQQNPNSPQGYPPNQGSTNGGYFMGGPNSGMNNAGPLQQPQRLPGQLIGANGVTTGGVVMAPNGQGVPLLVSADYLQNNRRTGQVKIIDASYDPSQPFVDFMTFQQQNMYGNFAQLSNQFVNTDYGNVHIIDAIYFNLDVATYPTRNQRYTLYPPNVFQNYVQFLGINQEDYLVVYSRDSLGGMRYAAAVWELFRIYNHSRISVLNGGLNAWNALGYEVTSTPAQLPPGLWTAGFDFLKVITFEEMAAIQPNGKCYFNEPDLFNFLDTRSRVDFNQNGRLIGSKNFPVDELIASNGFIVPATGINIALARANYTRGQISFVLGNNGPEAAFGILALAVVGENSARLYNGGLDEVRQRSPAILVRIIYCGGKILEAVNYWGLYNDSKNFVDSPLKIDPSDTLDNFEKIFGQDPDVTKIDKEKLQEFVDDHFLPPGHELQECVPTGWTESPEKLKTIKDPYLRDWAMKLNAIWKRLCKKMDPMVLKNMQRYSLLPVKYEFIAPGGRFLEPYYWDAYWIIKGLMASEMYEAAARMILNYRDFAEKYGFIPNGGRIYYLKRSQPPLFIPMVYEFYENTGNASFVKQLLPTMEKEFNYWVKNHQYSIDISGQKYTLYRYFAGSNVPRPESYQKDIDIAKNSSFTDKQLLYRDIASAAESGQDFCTRWFKDGMSMETIETTSVLPVDLNSFLCWNMDILDYLFDEVAHDPDSSLKYRNMLVEHRRTVHAVFYNNTEKAWLDFNINTKKHNPNFYAPLAAPLFTMCYNSLDQSKAEGVFQFFKRAKAFDYSSGIPESTISNSDQQWDFPNGWGHINHIVIEGLRKSASPEMQDQAFEIAKKWIRGNYRVYNATGYMWEKYDVVGTVPAPGKGGEYDVQDGFGWTNGAILDLLVTYADRITLYDDGENDDGSSTPPSLTTSENDDGSSTPPSSTTPENNGGSSREMVPIILTLFCASVFLATLS